jgi:hypothetical protein
MPFFKGINMPLPEKGHKYALKKGINMPLPKA